MEVNGSGSPLTARAKFRFEGANNDELSFDKNDVITITQQQEGGWWEGTHDGLTGWFPSAYVTLLTEKDKLMRSKSVPNASAKTLVDNFIRPDYRGEVLEVYIKQENEYVENLLKTMSDMLLPIGKSGDVNAKDYEILVGNFEEIYAIQKSILTSIEVEKGENLEKQKVGSVFLKSAADLRSALVKYAENHPKAVEVVKEKQKDFLKTLKENGKEIRDLVSGLSEPLRHLEKYHIVLQELERIVPENHHDRGDLQRSAAVFRETKDICETVRKQKEAQLDFLFVSKIEKIIPFSERGSILYVGVATVQFGSNDPVDRFIAVFTRYIIFFEVATNMAYQIQEKFPLTGFSIKKNEASEIILERSNNQSTKIFVSTNVEMERWMTAFSKVDEIKIVENDTNIRRKSYKGAPEAEYTQISKKPPHPPANSDMVTRRRRSKVLDESMNSSGMKFDYDLEMVLPEGFTLPSSSRNSRSQTDILQFSQFPSYFLSGNSGRKNEKGFKMRKDAARDEEMEFETLKIIEGYCIETVDSSDSHGNNDSFQPHLIVAEDEKILVEEMVGDEMVLQEKSIVDAVYSIKDQLSLLQTEFQKLSKNLESEQRARRRLEHNLAKNSGMISPEGSFSTPRNEINLLES